MHPDIEKIVAEARRNVDVQNTNFSTRELVRMVNEGEMSISPEYQRLFRWDDRSESRLIESMMLGLPVPSLFVATNDDFTLEVVDGLQRLSTLVHFVADSPSSLKQVGKDEPLRLTGLEVLSELNDLTYEELPRALQLYFSRTTLQITALTDKSDHAVRFELFDRLNAGSLRLTNQEVRNAVYRGPFVRFLHEMAGLETFRSTVRLNDERLLDGTLEEIALRFFSYRHRRAEYLGPIKPFLNECMDSWKMSFPEAQFREEFTGATQILSAALSGEPYLRGKFGWTPIMPYEAALLAAARLHDEGKDPSPLPGWKEDTQLRAVSGGGHNTPKKLDERVNRTHLLLLGETPDTGPQE